MIYCIDPNVDEPIMLIDRHIGFDENEGQGIDGALFQQELLMLDNMGKSRIQVWINSVGGIVMDGYNIYNAILKSKTKVDTYCVGIAASIAAVIFQAGRTRCMQDYGLLMYHNPYGGDGGEELEKMKTSIATMIAERTGKSQAEVLAIMSKTTWMTASEALTNGFCDEVEVSSDHNKKRARSNDIKAMWSQGNEVLNSILNKNNIKMTKVANKLGLQEGVNEDTIVASIADLQNKASKAEEIKKKMEDEKTAYEMKMEDLKAELEKCKAELDEEKMKAKKMEEEAEDKAIKNALEGYAKAGRIKNEAIGQWSETAKSVGIDKVKDMIETLPINKVANKITIDGSTGVNDTDLTNVAARTMANLRNKLEA